MKVSTLLSYAGGFFEAVDEVVALEASGLDTVFVPEAYGFDAPSLMGFIAARTERVRIGSGILPIYTRTPTLLAMTAAGVDALSHGRAMLGIGASGPQVIEGFHGVPYDAPATRIREIIQICRTAWKRERIVHEGRKYQVPLQEGGTGLGKPLKMITKPVREAIPITVASLAPRSVAMTAEVADGWLPTLYHPEHARRCWGQALDEGAARRDPARGRLEVFAGGTVGIGEGLEPQRERARAGIALYVGGMGARDKNFYNDVFAGYGYEAEAKEIQDLYLSGRKEEAAAAIPQSFLDETTLIGPAGFVKERLAAYQESGVTSLNVTLLGRTLDERRRTLDGLVDLIGQL